MPSNEKGKAGLTLLYNRPWALDQGALDELLNRAESMQFMPAVPLKPGTGGSESTDPTPIAVAFDFFAPHDDEDPKSVTTAVIPIFGVLDQRLSFFEALFGGGTSTETIGNQIRAALSDDKVERIILNIDSPGGSVDGVQILSDLIFEAREQKPIIALVNSLAASAAIWIATAAGEVVLSSGTVRTGSIGVVIAHREFSGLEKRLGIKTTEVAAGKFKRIISSFEPITAAGQQFLFQQVSTIYQVFLGAVARNRGADVKTVLADMAEGRIFIGQEAIDVGLADRIATLDVLLTEDNNIMPPKPIVIPGSGVITSPTLAPPTPAPTPVVTVDSIKADHRQVYDAIYTVGTTAERTRLTAIDQIAANAPEGSEDKIGAAKNDGTTPEALALDLMSNFSMRSPAPAPTSPTSTPRVTIEQLAQEAPPVVPPGKGTDPGTGAKGADGMTEEERVAVKGIAIANPA